MVNNIKLLPHQIKTSEKILDKLLEYNLCYLFGEPRSGKSLTALESSRQYLEAKNIHKGNILILTKKAAIDGWLDYTNFYSFTYGHRYIVVNYEQACKLNLKIDFYIQDESHNLGGVGKPNKRFKDIQKVVYDSPILMLSGTPIVETALSIYYQSAVSKYSPFNKYKNFYLFFREFGIPDMKYIGGGRRIECYKKFDNKLLLEIDRFSVSLSLKNAGINSINEDILHYFSPTDELKECYNYIVKHSIFKYKDIEIPLFNVPSVRMALHLLESGIFVNKDNNVNIIIESQFKAKINLLKEISEDFNKSTAIMCHFKAEQVLLSKALCNYKNVKIFSSTAHSEGVDLSDFANFIIYSQDYSGAKFIQRRNRIVNLNKNKNTKVHFLLIKNAISEQVYNTLCNKKDFNNSVFERESI